MKNRKIQRYILGGFAAALLTTLLLCLPTEADAANAWYYGKISRVWMFGDDEFIVTLDNNAIGDCQHRYAYFRKSKMPAGKLKGSFATALSAFYTNSTVGIVIDKDQPGACMALSIDVRK